MRYILNLPSHVQWAQDTKLSKWWARIPIFKKSVWVAVELPKSQESLLGLDIRECRLFKEPKNWSLRITGQKEAFALDPKNVLAVDLGEKHIATTVLLCDNAFVNPSFYGERVRGLRRHHAWLRKRLGEKKTKAPWTNIIEDMQVLRNFQGLRFLVVDIITFQSDRHLGPVNNVPTHAA